MYMLHDCATMIQHIWADYTMGDQLSPPCYHSAAKSGLILLGMFLQHRKKNNAEWPAVAKSGSKNWCMPAVACNEGRLKSWFGLGNAGVRYWNKTMQAARQLQLQLLVLDTLKQKTGALGAVAELMHDLNKPSLVRMLVCYDGKFQQNGKYRLMLTWCAFDSNLPESPKSGTCRSP